MMKISRLITIIVTVLLLVIIAGCDRNSDLAQATFGTGNGGGILVSSVDRRAMPKFILSSGKDKAPVESHTLQGRVLLVAFFTPWCSSCVDEMVMLQKFQLDYDPSDLAVIGMAVVSNADDPTLDRYVARLGLTFPVVVADDAVKKGFGGIAVVPTVFLVDRAGRIAARYFNHLEKEALIAAVHRVLAESSGE
ncbi:MAG: TlpA family protein disulfide reductase [Proteobacteria bacterium]|nr:TlpA family protein disulfide reductase [Pseudomonadota bacterium]MBU1687577.1 TlpA family protein disulfide reductase [Pseudomonadota bacterium]